jgi:hypothetical protein
LQQRWRERLGSSGRSRIGAAWRVGAIIDGDYKREIDLAPLREALGDAEVYSVQAQGADEAAACGVQTVAFDDLADCAAFISLMDRIVTIDTAAVHLAGAIGHPDISLLLGHHASWRWNLQPYANVDLYQQPTAGDWGSVLEAIKKPRPERDAA